MNLFWEKMVRPLMFRLDAERAHDIGMRALRSGLAGAFAGRGTEFGSTLEIERFGLRFSNPLGLAAGFDKNGVAVDQIAGLGFGFVESGTVTLHPQPGNEKPRIFRLAEDRALINRLGFNNEGARALVQRIAQAERACPIGINIGKNKDVPNEEAVENFVSTFEIVHPAADYIAVNVSSPNTPGLRDLQRFESLKQLIPALQQKNLELGRKPILLKIAPDLSDADIDDIIAICIAEGVDGIIATNTTISREGLTSADADRIGQGGLSGKPLAARSTEVISKIHRIAGDRLTIVGVGGIFSGDDAFEKIAAGASLVQAYTGFIYGGPSFAVDVLDRLAEILRERGFSTLDDAVGSGYQGR